MQNNITITQAISAAENNSELTYLLVEENENEWMVKVGCTRDEKTLKRRLSNLSTGNPRKLHLYTVFRGDDGNHPSIHCPQRYHRFSGYYLEQWMLNGALAQYRIDDTEWVRGVDPEAIVRLALFGEVPPAGTTTPWRKIAGLQTTGDADDS